MSPHPEIPQPQTLAEQRRSVATELVQTNELNTARYRIMSSLGADLFKGSSIVTTGEASELDCELGMTWMSEGARYAMPAGWSEYWMHKRLAPRIGRDVANEARAKGIPVHPETIQFLMEVEDIGRYILPGGYLTNDYIGHDLLHEAGIPEAVLDEMPSLERLMEVASTMDFTEEQLRFEEELRPDQRATAEEYFLSMSPTTRILNLVDNLAKRSNEGTGPIFNMERFIAYLKGQEQRYTSSSPAVPEPKNAVEALLQYRRHGAVLQAELVRLTGEWLEGQGVSINDSIERHQNSGPRILVLARHGEVQNPEGIVYTLDHHHRQRGEPVMDTSPEGRSQLEHVGEILSNRRFTVRQIKASDQERAIHSTEALIDGYERRNAQNKRDLLTPRMETDERLRDGNTPGPYMLRMKMKDFAATSGRVDTSEWDEYNHERPETILARMHNAANDAISSVRPGETAVLVSHGDPSAMLLALLGDGFPPNLDTMRNHDLYPAKGEAIAVIFEDAPDTGVLYPFAAYSLTNTPQSGKKTF